MFRIHKAQMEFFDTRERAKYLARLQAYLEADYPECFEEMSPEDVSAWVDRAVAVCDRYGVDTEREATQVVLLMLLLGTDADETYPWFAETMGDSALVAEGKVRKLLEDARGAGIEGVDDVDLGEPLEAP
jgi:hypothetical protein